MSELDVIKNTKQPITCDMLVKNLRSMGVNDGDILLVHSSLSSIGWVCGAEIAVIMSLLEAVGISGTVIMPAHTGNNSDPKDWNNPPVSEAWFDKIYESMPGFDKHTTPTFYMGKISEVFRSFPDTLRSNHPQTSFCAKGKYAKQITSTHVLCPQFGLDTPLGMLYNLPTKILLLGVDYSNCTSFHLAEVLCGGLPKVKQGASTIINNKQKWISFEDIHYDSDYFAQIGEIYETKTERVTFGNIGNAKSRLFDMKPAVDFAKEWIKDCRVITKNKFDN